MREYDAKLNSAHRELEFMRGKLRRAERSSGDPGNFRATRAMAYYARSHIIEELGRAAVLGASDEHLKMRFSRLVPELNTGFLTDMRAAGFIDGQGLTDAGIAYLRETTQALQGHDDISP